MEEETFLQSVWYWIIRLPLKWKQFRCNHEWNLKRRIKTLKSKYMNNIQTEVSIMITEAVNKLEQARELVVQVKPHQPDRFIVMNLLDFFCTIMPLRVLAEYRALREKGKI